MNLKIHIPYNCQHLNKKIINFYHSQIGIFTKTFINRHTETYYSSFQKKKKEKNSANLVYNVRPSKTH